MNTSVKNIEWQEKIFSAKKENFNSLALEAFRFQHENNPVYHRYCNSLNIDVNNIIHIQQIPYLPIQFFKTHQVTTTTFEPAVIFESSGTTQTINSKHFVKDTGLYEKSFTNTFRSFYGDPDKWCILALLPSYLERNNASLVMMADKLIQQSGHPLSGFYLNEWEKLHHTLATLEKEKQKTLLIGVTFALLDFATVFPMKLQYTTIMETGGMKGRREELTRDQVHEQLKQRLGLAEIHSEYGMTELLSQAYSQKNGIFNCPPWMKILLRSEDDPFEIISANNISKRMATGLINIIDLANIYSCSFIATDDVGKLYSDGSFEVLGRADNSDVRGCGLMVV